MIVYLFLPLLALSESRRDRFVIDLQPSGWQTPDKSVLFEMEPSRSGARVLYEDDGSLLIGFTLRTNLGLATRDKPPLVFRVLRFGRDLKLAEKVDFPTNNRKRDFMARTSSGNILISSNDSLAVTSRSLTTIRDLNSVSEIGISDSVRWEMLQSPSRKTSLIQRLEEHSYKLIELDSFKEIADCPSPAFINSIDDDSALRATSEVGGAHGTAVIYAWKLCSDTPKSVVARGGPIGRVSALSRGVYLQQGVEGIRAIDSSGKTLWERKAKRGEIWSGWNISINKSGTRFASMVTDVAGGNEHLDISSHVTALRVEVLDARSGETVFRCESDKTYPRVFGFALNDEGTEVVVHSDSRVFVCRESVTAP